MEGAVTYRLEPVLKREEIEGRIIELGKKLSADYEGKELVLVCVLRGSAYFTVDLSRQLTIPFALDFIAISNYSHDTDPLGIVKITKDLDTSISGKEVLIVEDIVDTGLTLNYLLRNIKTRHPAGLRVCTLLNVPSRRIVDVPVDYQGFELPNVFAVGYGLDYHEKYRNLLDIYSLIEE
ncbi:MAG: hypoxanthine phosphoribosyltransferase [Clostridiales bacterium]|jgi:hypoxanthine phosphoribosyltransferase|nr:hypoxanthine phosphoribosyltransferase [Clostridiales bacterium]